MWKNYGTEGEGRRWPSWLPGLHWPCYLLAVVVQLVHWPVLGVILGFLAVLYTCGLIITTGLSVWRLIQRDFGDQVDGGANMRPALNVVYFIALFQGVLFCYYGLFGRPFIWRKLVGVVVHEYNLGRLAAESVEEYLYETWVGCEKDLSFVKGRNLLTYAVELTKSGSPDGFLSGARILATLLNHPELQEQHAMIKQLVVSASSSEVLHKLLQALDCTRPNDGETRECAATIVAHLAGDLRLEQFPLGIQCIASLLEGPRPEEEYDDVRGYRVPVNYKQLMLQGLLILGKLTADANCRQAIVDTEGLLAKIMEPLSSGLLHLNGHNGAWSRTVCASMEVMRQLLTVPDNDKAGQVLRSKISGNAKVMDNMERILKCNECGDLLLQALEIYIQLQKNTLSDPAKRKSFINRLVLTFTQLYIKDDIRGLAGEKLVALSNSSQSDGKENAIIILQAKEDVIDDLTKILVKDDESNKCKISAAQILEQLCIHHTDGDEYIKRLKKSLNDTMPKVLAETIDRKNVSSSLLATVLSLCATMLRNFNNAEDLARQLDVTKRNNSFPMRLNRMVKWNSYPTMFCLKALKCTTEIFMLMVRHGCRYTEEEKKGLMDSLTEAATKMSDLEDFIMLKGESGTCTKTLDSLVKEAKEELRSREKENEMKVVINLPNSADGNPIE